MVLEVCVYRRLREVIGAAAWSVYVKIPKSQRQAKNRPQRENKGIKLEAQTAGIAHAIVHTVSELSALGWKDGCPSALDLEERRVTQW